MRFRRNAFSPLSPALTEFDEIDWSRKSQAGLGISDVPFKPDVSPITPGTAEKRGEEAPENIERPTNWAQRLEQKLWNWGSSGSTVKRWIVEIVSWTLSASCMAGIVGMLMVYHDKGIPKWPLGLTLNAYISVLSKVASAALLLPVSEALGQLKWSWFQTGTSKKMWDFEIFDNASRGPWGSFLLLVRTKGKNLAALGAAVTVFALMLDPFFQQVVEYPEVWRLQAETGQIPRAVSYAPFFAGKEYQRDFQTLEIDPLMLGLTNSYFYSNGSRPMNFGKGIRAEIPLACPNSNCTWTEYETFGIHSECTENRDSLEFKCLNKKLEWAQEPDSDELGQRLYTFPNGTSCGWWLKADDPLLMVGYNVDKNTNHSGEVLLSRAQPLYNIFSRKFMPGYEPKINNSRNPLAHVVIVSGNSLEDVRQNMTPTSHECMFSWAAKTLLSNYSEGGYSETVVKTMINDTVIDAWEVVEIPNEEDMSLTLWDYTYNENVVVKGTNDTVYAIANGTHVSMVAMFDDVFPSTYTLINSTDEADALLRYKMYYNIIPRSRNLTWNPFMHGDVPGQLERLAEAMTNVMRSQSRNTENVEGLAYDKESIVQVRWVWLSLPLGLLLFTGIFLLATVRRSSKEQDHVGVWKTSAIATLFYGLPDDMSKKMMSSQEHGTPRAKAKEVKVKWMPDGWRFSGLSTVSPTAGQDTSSTPVKSRQSPPVQRPTW